MLYKIYSKFYSKAKLHFAIQSRFLYVYTHVYVQVHVDESLPSVLLSIVNMHTK